MMVTFKDIRKAIVEQLKKTGVTINSHDVRKGFERPSFFIQFTNNERSADETQIQKSLTVSIYYFPSDEYEYAIEMLDMQETLGELFDLKLPVKDRSLNIIGFNAFVNDGVLNCIFDISAFEYGKEMEEVEPMESIDFQRG